MTARFVVGDTRAATRQLADGSVDLIFTSPPFLALRSYLPADHPDKHLEIGSEPDPAGFLATLLGLTDEWARVLAPHGSLCVELGDTYSGSGGGGGDYLPGGMREGQAQFAGSAASMRESNAAHWRAKATRRDSWPLPKSLCMIPSLYPASLAYGWNMLNPDQKVDRWRIRNLVAWVRPNPPVGELGDKFRPATSYVTVACKASDRWFDLDAVRRPGDLANFRGTDASRGKSERHTLRQEHPAGAPPLDWWKISPSGYPGSHYAVFPPELVEVPLEAMCPRRVCRTCGTPSRRQVERESTGQNTRKSRGLATDPRQVGAVVSTLVPDFATRTTLGWSTCGCPGTDGLRLDGYHTGEGWRPGLVLDPFAGSGTTLAVASGHSRDSIGFDLDDRNAALAAERVGMFLTVDHLADLAAEAAV
jgi:site-specific DNA-methyltransferase (adenine-specific)